MDWNEFPKSTFYHQEPMMAEHPTIFSTDMVRAILGGRKTQTRRIIKPQPYKSDRNPPNYSDIAVGDLFICPDYFPTEEKGGRVIIECESLGTYHCMGINAFVDKHCPYGQVGDRLWVRESILLQTEKGSPYFDVLYCADKSHLDNKHELDDWFMSYSNWYGLGKDKQIIPSTHMKKELCRIFLEITNIRVEQIQDIDAEEAEAEGIRRPKRLCPDRHDEYILERFQRLWDSLNAKRGYGWDKNPWVWIIEFKRTNL